MNQQRGSAIIYVILMSTSIFIILIALLNQASVIFKSSYTRYHEQLAREAAEAGAAYANSCLNLYNHVQTWGPGASGGARPNLLPSTDCTGSPVTPSVDYVVDEPSVRSYFSVGDLDSSEPESAQVSATGYSEVLSNTGAVRDTYTYVIKKSITWPGIYAAERSASGTYRTCAILSGSPYCWGRNRYGQLGNGQAIGSGDIEDSSSVDTTKPVKVRQQVGVLAGKYVTDIFSAMYHNCALASGKVYCWGWNEYGQLGNGSAGDYSSVPVEVGGALSGKTVTAIGGSGNTSCAIAEGKIYCWGLNSIGSAARGVVGTNNGSTSYFSTPQAVTAGNTATTLPSDYTATKLTSTGSRSYNMCAIADDQAYCWGNNDRGAVGDNSSTDRLLPTKVYQQTGLLLGKKVIDISLDGFYSTSSSTRTHVCAVATNADGSDGRAYCWGENSSGQLGNSSTSDAFRPVAVRANAGDQLYGRDVSAIASGLYHTCAVADAEAFCWGSGSLGQLGNSTWSYSTRPVRVSQLAGGLLGATVIGVGGGSNRGCVVTDEGKTFCWGRNSEGQIGDGTLIDRNRPTESLYLRPKTGKYYF